VLPAPDKDPEVWSAIDKFTVVLETAGLNATELGAYCRERISKGRKQPLVHHVDNGNAMRAATLESHLDELGVLRSFSRSRVSNANPYLESLFKTAK
jgi:transposase InsO family protein